MNEPLMTAAQEHLLSSHTIVILALIHGLLPAMTAIIGGLWIFYTYLDHQREAQRALTRQADMAAVTRRLEAQRPFLEKQLALYFEAAQVTGKFASLKPGTEPWDNNESRFWQLYWSELSMVETHAVEEAMVIVGGTLEKFKVSPNDDKKKQALDDAIYDLAHAIRSSIESAWKGE